MSDSRLTLPGKTVQRLTDWMRTQRELQALIDATLMASREALNVPDEWLIRDVAEGFVAPPMGARPDPEANGNGASVAQAMREAVG